MASCVLLGFLFFCGASALCNRQFGFQDAIMIIDVQNGFLPDRMNASSMPTQPVPNSPYIQNLTSGLIYGGSLAVNHAEEVIPVINQWIDAFEDLPAADQPKVMASLDWHPQNSCSFCSTGGVCVPMGMTTCGESGTELPDCAPKNFTTSCCPHSLATRCQDSVSVSDYLQGTYVQWPLHCVQGSWGAKFDPYLRIPSNAVVVKKGFLVQNDSYSAYGGRLTTESAPFNDNTPAQTDQENLEAQDDLKQLIELHEINRLWVTGIATDYCVKNTILDSLGANVAGLSTRPNTLAQPFSVILVQSAARGVSPVTVEAAVELVQQMGAVVIPANITDPQQALDYYCDIVDAYEAMTGGTGGWVVESSSTGGTQPENPQSSSAPTVVIPSSAPTPAVSSSAPAPPTPSSSAPKATVPSSAPAPAWSSSAPARSSSAPKVAASSAVVPVGMSSSAPIDSITGAPQGQSSDDTNKAVAIGLGIGLTVLGLAILAIICVFCNRKRYTPKAINFGDEESYKPLHDDGL